MGVFPTTRRSVASSTGSVAGESVASAPTTATVKIPPVLRPSTDGEKEVTASGRPSATVLHAASPSSLPRPRPPAVRRGRVAQPLRERLSERRRRARARRAGHRRRRRRHADDPAGHGWRRVIRAARFDEAETLVSAYEWLFAPPGRRPPQWDAEHAVGQLARSDRVGRVGGAGRRRRRRRGRYLHGLPRPRLGPLRPAGVGRGPRRRWRYIATLGDVVVRMRWRCLAYT